MRLRGVVACLTLRQEPDEESPDDEPDDDDDLAGVEAPVEEAAAAAAAPAADDSEGEDDGFGEDFIGDEADRAALAAMTEVRREEILYERAAARQEARERRTLRSDLAARAKGVQPRTRSAPAAKSRSVGAKEAALAEIKARKASSERRSAAVASKRAEDAVRRAEARGARDAAAADAGVEDDEEEGERGARDRGAAPDDDDESAEDDDTVYATFAAVVRSCLLTRRQLELWVDKPFFDSVVTGCFVRIALPVDGPPKYRMAQVGAVLRGSHRGAELRPYDFGTKNGAPLRTTIQLLLRHGAQEHAFKMSMVSNSPPEEKEWEGWATAAGMAGIKPLRETAVLRKATAIAATAHFTWDAAAVAAVVAARRATAGAPRNVAFEKEMLQARLDVIQQDVAAGGLGEEQAAAMEEESEALRDALRECDARVDRLPKGASTMGGINKRNAVANVNILDVAAREAAAAAAAAAAKGPGAKGSDADPFSRRRTRVNNYWNTGKGGKGGDEEPGATEGGAGEPAAAPPPHPAPPPPDAHPPPPEPGPPHAAADEAVAAPPPAPAAPPAVSPPAAAPAPALSAFQAAHAAAFRPLELPRACFAPYTLPLLRHWVGGSGGAEAALRSGRVLISIGDYKQRHEEAERARGAQARAAAAAAAQQAAALAAAQQQQAMLAAAQMQAQQRAAMLQLQQQQQQQQQQAAAYAQAQAQAQGRRYGY